MKTQIRTIIAFMSMLLFSTILLAGEGEVKILRVTNPPINMGVKIGDVLNREIQIEVASPYQLSKSTFPVKGTRQNGIELVEISVLSTQGQKKTDYKIALKYQVFANATTPVVMKLPTEKLAVTGGAKALSLNIPEWSFWFSPLVVTDAATAKVNMHPQERMPLVDIVSHKARLTGYIALLLVGLIGLVYINANGKWLPFMGGAFAQAHRKLKRLTKEHSVKPEDLVKSAYLCMHQAFNTVFGRSLFASNVEQFVSEHPRFLKLRQEIESFFENSNQSLFGQNEHASHSIESLIAFSKTLRDCERGV
jgi:mxaA protein